MISCPWRREGERLPNPPVSRLIAALCVLLLAPLARADETCQSPFMPKLVGTEDYVYVWTLGMDGVGDESDKLVTVDAKPSSFRFGQVLSSVSVGSQNEAHHGGLTDDRRHFWAGGLDTSKIFIFDIATDPASPKLVKTIDDFVAKTGGVVGPHGFYALPGRMLISALSSTDGSGKTALVEYSNAGEYIRTIWMPESAPYGYDVRVSADLNRMLTSSFTGKSNYMTRLADVLADPEASKKFGSSVVVWDFHARKPLQVLEIPGAPLEIRWALVPHHNYAFTTTALTSKLWGIFRTSRGEFEAVELADIGRPSEMPLPVDISLSADDRYLFVSTFLDGHVRVFDVGKPRKPRLILDKKIGDQVNMVSQSWDGKRIYITSSLLSRWDGHGGTDPQFLKSYDWQRKDLAPRFEIDFIEKELGRPHLMRFGQKGFWSDDKPVVSAAPTPGSVDGGE
jgi:selenium-binding protein 1